ncbi:hypothetical protein PHMEG_00026506, partial [Phytophthora megakarya]
FTTSGKVRLVGIPATREHIKAGALVEDGYGGLETYIQMESLGLGELARLTDHVTDDEDIHDFVLTPREAPLSDSDLDEAIKSVEFQREMASILTEFVPDQLSQLVFGTVSLLRKVTAENIMLKRQLAVADPVTQDFSNGPIEIERLKKEVTFVRGAYQKYIQKIEEDHEYHAGRHRADLQDFLDENQVNINIHGLHARGTDLQQQLRSEVVHQVVSERPVLDVDILMNFLNANAQLSLQWPRLKRLLEHHRDKLPVPSSWKTTISIMAADDPTIPTTAYVPVPPSDKDDEEHKDEDGLSKTNTRGGYLDLSAGPSDSSSKGTGKRKRQSQSPAKTHARSSQDVPTEIQEYPSQWIRESNDKCRPDGDLLLRRVDTVGDWLEPYPVVWDQLRLDPQALILFGINYEDTLGWLGDDRLVHTCFHQGPYLEMLLRMMFWNEPDATPWSKYVPRRYFIAARAKLDTLLESNLQPGLWGPLEPVLDESLDDDTETPDHDDLADQNWTLEGDDHDDFEDDDDLLDQSPPKAKRRRIAPLEKKNRSKREYQQATCTALALKDNLTPAEMMIIEVPANDKVRSWVHNGVRMKWCEKSLHSPFGQTPGFLAYTPNRHDMALLRQRFADYYMEYRAIIQEAPWREMWNRRPKELRFHKRSAMTPEAQGGLDDRVEHMAGITRHQWEMLHWVIFLLTLLPESAVMAEVRRNKRHEALVKKSKSLKRRVIPKGVPETVFKWKTGVRDIPNRVCHWIIMDKSQLDPTTGRHYSLREQLLRLDTAEPARLQRTNLATVEEQIAHLPKKVRKRLLPEAEREPISDDI